MATPTEITTQITIEKDKFVTACSRTLCAVENAVLGIGLEFFTGFTGQIGIDAFDLRRLRQTLSR
ncbi:hypothetical protein [Leptolyngbya sp. 7M]|uniref:hypothetical protein n=1 Tax=Leptolyngbya sp. 7M TaxID=2812896 RepID=UPI001B8CD089|nr:hypothetical protein [Leptolyngbya sp. 7M]QYO66156.1 hypothetical protein JVX88_04975 [Leptolyngbya sp. 7M]